MCKVRGQSASWLVEQRIDGADERIVTIIYIVLIGSPTVIGCCRVQFADLHHGNVLLKGDIGGVTAVVEPVGTDDAERVVVTLNIVDNGCTGIHSSNVGG